MLFFTYWEKTVQKKRNAEGRKEPTVPRIQKVFCHTIHLQLSALVSCMSRRGEPAHLCATGTVV